MTRWGSATAWALLIGVLVSCAFLVAGLLWQLGGGGSSSMLQASELSGQLEHFSAPTLVHLGILVLMATPLARLVVLTIEFAKSREYAFAAIAIGVLFLLGLSVVIGLSQEW